MIEKRLGRLLRASRGRKGEPGRHCLSEETISLFAEGKVDDRARMGIEKHLAGCAFCREQIGSLVRPAEEIGRETVPAALLERARDLVPPSSPTTIWAYQWAAAAAVFLVTAAVVWQVWVPLEPIPAPLAPRTAPAPAPRATPSPSVAVPPAPTPSPGRTVRSAPVRATTPEIIFPLEGAELRQGNVRFHWRDVPTRVFYEVQVVSDEGALVWESRTESNRVALPPDVGLQPGTVYFVWVRADLQDGKTIKSTAVRFQVAGQ